MLEEARSKEKRYSHAERRQQILWLLGDGVPLTAAQIALELGLTRESARLYLVALLDEGKVACDQRSTPYTFALPDDYEALMTGDAA